MFQSSILDVALGLIIVYLVLALVCTSIMEYISQILGLRAEILWRAVMSLFQNSGKAAAEKFAKQIYGQDLVDALSPPGERPSYIPAQMFSLALVESLGIHTDAQVAGTTPILISTILANAKSAHGALDAGDPRKLDSRIFDTLRPLAVAAGTNLDLFRKNVESWFESSMQRASGWYKRRVQVIIFFVSFAVVFIFNADSLMLADTLWANPAARTALASSAQPLDKLSPPPKVGGASPSGKLPAANPAASGQASNATRAPMASSPEVQQAQSNVMKLIGWSGPIWGSAGYDPQNVHRFPRGWGEWLAKVLGLLLTAFAASLGAPFWFGALNKIMSIRNAGVSPNDPKAVQPARIASNGGN